MRSSIKKAGAEGLGWEATVGGQKPRTEGEDCGGGRQCGGLLVRRAAAGRKCDCGRKKPQACSRGQATGSEEALAKTTHFLTFHSAVISMGI